MPLDFERIQQHGSILVHRLQRWPNIDPVFSLCPVFLVMVSQSEMHVSQVTESKYWTMPYYYQVHSSIDGTAHSSPLNSLEHCICTTPRTNIRPSRDSCFDPRLTAWAIGAGQQVSLRGWVNITARNIRWTNAGLMLGMNCWWWTNIKSASS